MFETSQGAPSMLLELLVLPFDLLAGLGGEVFLDESEIGSEANDELGVLEGTSQRKF